MAAAFCIWSISGCGSTQHCAKLSLYTDLLCALFQAGRPFRSKESGKMGYEDFVWFIMSEEDKSSEMALDYWFKCCDLDGDGCLRANEMLVGSVYCRVALSAPPVLLTKPCLKAYSEDAKEVHKCGAGCHNLLNLLNHGFFTASEAPSCCGGILKHASKGVELRLATSSSILRFPRHQF